MKGSRMNDIIRMVNTKIPKEQAGLKTPEEEKFWDGLVAEAKMMEARTGKPVIFDNVEIETDDPRLDIYSE